MSRQCPYCEYQTEKASTLSMHISMKHKSKRAHQCYFCHKRFSQATQLQHHIINHHSKPQIHCKEPSCNAVFKNETSHKIHYVRRHMKHLHLFERSSMPGMRHCLSCGTFTAPSAMYYHVAICSPQSPFCKQPHAAAPRRDLMVEIKQDEYNSNLDLLPMNVCDLDNLGDLDNLSILGDLGDLDDLDNIETMDVEPIVSNKPEDDAELIFLLSDVLDRPLTSTTAN